MNGTVRPTMSPNFVSPTPDPTLMPSASPDFFPQTYEPTASPNFVSPTPDPTMMPVDMDECGQQNMMTGLNQKQMRRKCNKTKGCEWTDSNGCAKAAVAPDSCGDVNFMFKNNKAGKQEKRALCAVTTGCEWRKNKCRKAKAKR